MCECVYACVREGGVKYVGILALLISRCFVFHFPVGYSPKLFLIEVARAKFTNYYFLNKYTHTHTHVYISGQYQTCTFRYVFIVNDYRHNMDEVYRINL